MHNQGPSSQTDEEIALCVQKGDVESFGLLVERYEAKMTRYARRFLFGTEDAEDVVQEVFIKAYVNIQSFEAKRKFSSWLYRIAHNEFINALKKKGKDPMPFFDPDTLFPHPVAPEQTDRVVLEKELKEELNEYLDRLEPRYREPLLLYYFEEMSYKEISEILQIPLSTVGVRIKRGKDAMKKMVMKLDPSYAAT